MSTIALASTAQVRSSVVRQFRQGGAAENEQAAAIASAQAIAYADRMAQLGTRAGQRAPGPSELADDVQEELAKRARAAAQGITRTYNDDLRGYVAAQLAADPALTQAELSRQVRDWAGQRADWKAPQVATTQATAARHMADQQFIRRNAITAQARVSPSEAECDECQALVDQGWMDAGDAAGLELPVHPNCEHELAYRGDLGGDGGPLGNLWLGGA